MMLVNLEKEIGEVPNQYDTVSWYVGQSPPIRHRRVAWVQADGDELESVRAVLPHLTPNNRLVALWRGDLAQLVYDNVVVLYHGNKKT